MKEYSILEAAAKFFKSPDTIRRWIKDGMPARQSESGKYYIRHSDLVAYRDRKRTRK